MTAGISFNKVLILFMVVGEVTEQGPGCTRPYAIWKGLMRQILMKSTSWSMDYLHGYVAES